MSRYFKLAFEAPLASEQVEKIRQWCHGHLFLDAWLDVRSNPPVMYFATPQPRTIRELNSSVKMNFRNWGIQFTPYRRGTLTQVPLEEYAQVRASPFLENLVIDTVQSIVAKASAAVAARDDAVDRLTKKNAFGIYFREWAAHAKLKKAASLKADYRFLFLATKPCLTALKANVEEIRDEKRLEKLKQRQEADQRAWAKWQADRADPRKPYCVYLPE